MDLIEKLTLHFLSGKLWQQRILLLQLLPLLLLERHFNLIGVGISRCGGDYWRRSAHLGSFILVSFINALLLIKLAGLLIWQLAGFVSLIGDLRFGLGLGWNLGVLVLTDIDCLVEGLKLVGIGNLEGLVLCGQTPIIRLLRPVFAQDTQRVRNTIERVPHHHFRLCLAAWLLLSFHARVQDSSVECARMAWLQLEHFLERIVGFVRLVALFIENA